MTTRVFFLFALFFCACDSTTENDEKDTGVSVEQNAKEIVEVVEYHPNGAVKLKGKRQGEKRIGKWESFYPTGYRWSETIYQNGLRQGESITYYPNGMMRFQGRYYNDEKAGIWIFYDRDGTVIQKMDMDEIQADSKSDTTGQP